MDKYTVYATYVLQNDSEDNLGLGYSSAIHCNYISKAYIDEIGLGEVSLYFFNLNVFRYLNPTGCTGCGYSANRISLLVQIVENDYDVVNDVYIEKPPKTDEWRKYDVTHQLINHISGDTISSYSIGSSVFTFPFTEYNFAELYTLDYLNYPSELDDNPFAFGEEQFFFGNVTTDIQAIAHATDLPITLPLGEFNTTTNKTWDGSLDTDVFITEVGLYDSNNNLVAVGKLNNPIRKNPNTSRTILFGIDF